MLLLSASIATSLLFIYIKRNFFRYLKTDMKELIIAFVFLICYSRLQAQERQPNYDETKVPKYVLPDV